MPEVHVRYLKYPERLHWHFTMRRLGEDDHGVWLGGTPGTTLRRGSEDPVEARVPFLVLVPRDRWWTISWTLHDGGTDMYVDINTPPAWHGDKVEMIDLDLDVIRRHGADAEVVDEDEFIDHSRTLGYPPALIAAARTTTAEVVLAAEAGTEPFGTAHLPWSQRLSR
jgi:hypothetical protein